MKRLPWMTLAFAVLAAALHSSPQASALLQFDRQAVFNGEIWRAFTGHFTHFGVDHLRWDLIAFVAFGSLAEIRSRRAFLISLTTAALVISLSVGLLQPQFLIYRGLSGLDSALFGLVVAELLRTGRQERDLLLSSFAALALTGFLAKSAYEIMTGRSFFVESSTEFIPVPLAHLSGAAVGIVVGWRQNGRDFSRERRPLAGSEKTPSRPAAGAPGTIIVAGSRAR